MNEQVAQLKNKAGLHVKQGMRRLNGVFTAHPESAGETYWEHLWFTISMSSKLLYGASVIMLHGLFPFVLVREGSKQIERIYSIMKSRIPKARRDEIDLDYSV